MQLSPGLLRHRCLPWHPDQRAVPLNAESLLGTCTSGASHATITLRDRAFPATPTGSRLGKSFSRRVNQSRACSLHYARRRDKLSQSSRGVDRRKFLTKKVKDNSIAPRFSRSPTLGGVVSLSKHGVLGILVYLGLVLDVLGAIRVPTHPQSTRKNGQALYRSTYARRLWKPILPTHIDIQTR